MKLTQAAIRLLCLRRRYGERLRITVQGVEFWVHAEYKSANSVEFIFEAPDEVRIVREELIS